MISGANRDIGLEFAQQYAADGWQVYATARLATGLRPNLQKGAQKKAVAVSSLAASMAKYDVPG